ncbi:hypothetical protein PR002_g26501 [Phytophthora rubi]|uniref:Probable pectate lyase F n=2 Tax=Phytophthora TaxID=4783 RepID=A0A6A3HU32_9STRA|nr:hypothetical protein PR002_g26501 [Phytophthora rubi]
MVKIRTATVASMVVLLSTTLSAALAEDTWGDAAQYSSGNSVTQPKTESSEKDKNSDTPSSSWTQAPSTEGSGKNAANSWKQGSGNYWSQGPTASWGSSKKSDGDNKNDGDNQSDNSSNGATQAPTTSESSGKSGDDKNDVGSSKSSKTSESNEDSWKQEAITFSTVGSKTSETTTPTSSSESSATDEGSDATTPATSSAGSQTTGGGSSTTPSTSGGSVPDGTWPTSAGVVQFAEARIIKAGEVFDGKMKTYERSDVTCQGQSESGASTAVFKMEPGSTLKNVIIGKNQMEGVHCDKHDCTIENVWWDDVCEDALSVKGGTPTSVTTVTGGGARSADDKVIQHNGFGTVKIDGFYGEDISKLYRSCGTCGDKQRKVSVTNVYIVNPDNAVVTVNKNWKDEATLSNIWVKSAGKKKVKICQWSQGNADGEPSMLGDGPSPPLCQYSESDIHINGDVSKAGGSTPSQGSTPSTPSDGSSTSQNEPATSVASSDEGESGGDVPVESSAGSQTSVSVTPTTESSAGGDESSADDTSVSKGGDDGADTTTGSETSDGQTTQGSSTSGGSQTSQTTISTSSGTLPDGTWPTSTGAVKFTKPRVIKSGEVFDGKMQTFDRSDITCTGGEGQKDTAVFLVEAGGTLKNAIIGKNQKEGVHCDDHDCAIENVWWDDVCEDALSIKGGTASSVTTVTNCGARSASDKVVQHNGYGTVNIDGFYAETFGKLYRSCGTCGDIPRIVTLKNVYAVDPLVSVVTVNKNYGDKATLGNIWVKSSKGKDLKVCQWSQGSKTPTNVGDGPSPPLCQYTDSDIHINQDISQAGASSPSKPSGPTEPSAPTKPSDGSSTSETQYTEAPATSSESSDDVAGSDDAGSDESIADAPATSSGGSQTSETTTPTSSSESSATDEGSEPATSSGGSQTSETTTPTSSSESSATDEGSDATTPASSSAGSQTTGGGSSSTPSTSGGTVPDGTWPTSAGVVQFAEAHIIKAGEVFDGKMKTYERSDVTCQGQSESGASTAVFKMEPGSTLKNVIIGKNQMEGVHCDKHDCTIENVWWDDVCEDALSVKGGTPTSVTTVTGGGARSADDKVIQHNGFGTVKIDGFYGEDISKLYRSCGTCGDKQRKVSVTNVYIVNPDNAIVTVNKNWKDEATLSNIWVKSAGKKKVKICQWSQGNADGEPSMLGDGPSPPLCQYSESDIHINGDVSKAGGSTPSQGSTPSTPSEGSDSEQLPGTVSPDSPDQSSGNNDESSSSQSQTESTESPATSSESGVDGGDDNTDTKTWSQAASKTSDDNNGDKQKTSSKSSNGDNKEEESSSKTSGGDKKSDNTESDSTQQQEIGDESVMQSEVGGEADPTAVKSDSATKESMFMSTTTTSTSKCNIRRRRN